MDRTAFDGLRVVRRMTEDARGDAALCEDAQGESVVRLTVRDHACQRALLMALEGRVPARMDAAGLTLVFPDPAGGSYRAWTLAARRSLGERRDQCLSVLRSAVEARWPAALLVMAARPESVTTPPAGAVLRPIADFARWQPGADGRAAANALARLFCAMLAADGAAAGRKAPEELRLLRARTEAAGYDGLASLHRDLAALPDEPPPHTPLRRAAQRLRARYGAQCARILPRAALVLLALLAALSVAAAARRQAAARQAAFPGLARIGNEQLAPKEVSP